MPNINSEKPWASKKGKNRFDRDDDDDDGGYDDDDVGGRSGSGQIQFVRAPPMQQQQQPSQPGAPPKKRRKKRKGKDGSGGSGEDADALDGLTPEQREALGGVSSASARGDRNIGSQFIEPGVEPLAKNASLRQRAIGGSGIPPGSRFRAGASKAKRAGSGGAGASAFTQQDPGPSSSSSVGAGEGDVVLVNRFADPIYMFATHPGTGATVVQPINPESMDRFAAPLGTVLHMRLSDNDDEEPFHAVRIESNETTTIMLDAENFPTLMDGSNGGGTKWYTSPIFLGAMSVAGLLALALVVFFVIRFVRRRHRTATAAVSKPATSNFFVSK